jgi:hypothetical protein
VGAGLAILDRLLGAGAAALAPVDDDDVHGALHALVLRAPGVDRRVLAWGVPERPLPGTAGGAFSKEELTWARVIALLSDLRGEYAAFARPARMTDLGGFQTVSSTVTLDGQAVSPAGLTRDLVWRSPLWERILILGGYHDHRIDEFLLSLVEDPTREIAQAACGALAWSSGLPRSDDPTIWVGWWRTRSGPSQ